MSGLKRALGTAAAALIVTTAAGAPAVGAPAADARPVQPDDGYVTVDGDIALPAGSPGARAAVATGAPAAQPQAALASPTIRTTEEGFQVFPGIPRNRGPYVFVLIASDAQAAGEVEGIRDEIATVAADLASITGYSFTVDPSAPQTEPEVPSQPCFFDRTEPGCIETAGELWVRVAEDSPCGQLNEFTIGCGGPDFIDTLTYPDAGSIWVSSPYVNLGPTSSEIAALLRHEGGHALGLAHFAGEYEGTTQLMNPFVQPGQFLYELGDQNGLQFLAPGCDSSFPDVSDSSDFCDAIRYASTHGIVNGYDDDTFRPSRAVSRMAAAAFMFRTAANSATYTPPSTPTFPDVPTTHPFFREIEWLAANGITTGYVDGTFRPSNTVTRQAMARYLHVLLATRGTDPDPQFVEAATQDGRCLFWDVSASSQFCEDILWIFWNGYTTGFSDGTYRSTSAVSRQAMSAFMVRGVLTAPP